MSQLCVLRPRAPKEEHGGSSYQHLGTKVEIPRLKTSTPSSRFCFSPLSPVEGRTQQGPQPHSRSRDTVVTCWRWSQELLQRQPMTETLHVPHAQKSRVRSNPGLVRPHLCVAETEGFPLSTSSHRLDPPVWGCPMRTGHQWPVGQPKLSPDLSQRPLGG